jgi:hypothetical protein
MVSHEHVAQLKTELKSCDLWDSIFYRLRCPDSLDYSAFVNRQSRRKELVLEIASLSKQKGLQ